MVCFPQQEVEVITKQQVCVSVQGSGSASFIVMALCLPNGLSKDPAVNGRTHMLLPSNQWDGLESLFPGCFTVVLLTLPYKAPLINNIPLLEVLHALNLHFRELYGFG